jgi:ABC-type bacteriocin/lantibiotic exporter with double-glycine peptidase domain
VLDEPTSALDPASARVVLKTLRGLKGGGTLIRVTHRVGSVGDCDRACQLEGGEGG